MAFIDAAELARLHACTLDGIGVAADPSDDYLLRSHGCCAGSVELDTPEDDLGNLRDALAMRRSSVHFTGDSLPLSELSLLLSTTLCAHDDAGLGPGLGGGRPYPSGGALYPLEVLVVPMRVPGLEPRAWWLQPVSHRLVPLGPPLDPVALTACFANDGVSRGAVLVLLVADFDRPDLHKYAGKSYRLMLLEAGHMMQNLALAVAARGLAMLPTCGYADIELAVLCGLRPPRQALVYAAALGGSGDA